MLFWNMSFDYYNQNKLVRSSSAEILSRALVGSKMATTADLSSMVGGRKTLPRALMPKDFSDKKIMESRMTSSLDRASVYSRPFRSNSIPNLTNPKLKNSNSTPKFEESKTQKLEFQQSYPLHLSSLPPSFTPQLPTNHPPPLPPALLPISRLDPAVGGDTACTRGRISNDTRNKETYYHSDNLYSIPYTKEIFTKRKQRSVIEESLYPILKDALKKESKDCGPHWKEITITPGKHSKTGKPWKGGKEHESNTSLLNKERNYFFQNGEKLKTVEKELNGRESRLFQEIEKMNTVKEINSGNRQKVSYLREYKEELGYSNEWHKPIVAPPRKTIEACNLFSKQFERKETFDPVPDDVNTNFGVSEVQNHITNDNLSVKVQHVTSRFDSSTLDCNQNIILQKDYFQHADLSNDFPISDGDEGRFKFKMGSEIVTSSKFDLESPNQANHGLKLEESSDTTFEHSRSTENDGSLAPCDDQKEKKIPLQGSAISQTENNDDVIPSWKINLSGSVDDLINEDLNETEYYLYDEGEVVTVQVEKSRIGGIGFSIEGGKGSLTGDRPILIKRLFRAESSLFKSSDAVLKPGDEIISLAGQSLSELSHYSAWNFIKSLPDGPVTIVVIRRNSSI